MTTDSRDVSAIDSLVGMPVLSLATGNKIGQMRGLLIDPQNGLLTGLQVDNGWLPYDKIHNFGRDAIMAESETAALPIDASASSVPSDTRRLLGARVVAESGQVIGRISNVFVTLRPPPFLIYEIRRSFIDLLLGRRLYLASSAEHTLSDDSARLLVPQAAIDQLADSVASVAERAVTVRTFTPPLTDDDDEDETVVRRDDDGDETVVRVRDEDETVVRRPKLRR